MDSHRVVAGADKARNDLVGETASEEGARIAHVGAVETLDATRQPLEDKMRLFISEPAVFPGGRIEYPRLRHVQRRPLLNGLVVRYRQPLVIAVDYAELASLHRAFAGQRHVQAEQAPVALHNLGRLAD